MGKVFVISLIATVISLNSVFALEYTEPELSRAYNRQQIKSTDSKGNKILVTPHYESYAERNQNVSEKIVAIYDKKAPEGAYGARYVLYTPIKIGKRVYVGYHKIQQPSPNGYGYENVWDGGEFSDTPCFESIDKARHYYYPQWY